MVEALSEGRSPHARGRRPWLFLGGSGAGSIPACAGEAGEAGPRLTTFGVDPRMRGGGSLADVKATLAQGRSPHARGRPERRRSAERWMGSIPACAGEASSSDQAGDQVWVDPRMRGGGPPVKSSGCARWGRSPHARGRPSRHNEGAKAMRSIPACAGEAFFWYGGGCMNEVDPRMRGGGCSRLGRCPVRQGRSPHARGRRSTSGDAASVMRSIPACAGEAIGYSWACSRCEVDPRMRGGGSIG